MAREGMPIPRSPGPVAAAGALGGPRRAAWAGTLLATGLLLSSLSRSPTLPARSADPSAAPAPVVAGHRLEQRWVYIPTNFQVDANVPRVTALLDRAQAAGYNGALVADVKLGRLDDGSLIPAYYRNLAAVLDHARGLELELVPSTADFGYSAPLLWHDPNLAEGLPVRDASFRVESGRLLPFEDPPLAIANGDFETLPASGDQFPGWAWQDKPGEATFVDRAVRHGGRASLRMEALGARNAPSGNGRIQQRLAVAPFRYYHVSVWVKTQDFQGGELRVLALGEGPSRTLQWNGVPVQATQDWTRFDVTFNTLSHREVLFYLGVWGGGSGRIWWDDARIEPGGFVNLIRRPGAPLAVTSADGGLRYEEGRDFEPIADPRMGRVPWPGAYDLWHAPPEVRLAPGSRIAEGQVLRASYHHMASIYGDQVTASLTEPAVFEIVRGQLASIRREWSAAGMFKGWMLAHDEIRVGGWDAAPRPGGGTPGEALAFNIRSVAADAWAIDPEAALYTWSDMFDPEHNAAPRAEPYYLVNGDWAGSWEGLPPEVTVLNWNHQAGRRRRSAEHFAARGHRQILAGYYDRPAERFEDRAWLEELAGVPGISGVLYTQWGSGYEQLEAWARHVWGDATWTTPEPAGTAAPVTATPIATPQASSLPGPSPRAFLPWAGH